MIRTTKQTKNDIKTIFELDENLFWDVLARHLGSLTGHIRRTIGITRTKVKKCHKALINQKEAQSIFNKWLTGDLFKKFDKSTPVVPRCTYCKTAENTWEHFMECTGIILLTPKKIACYKKWKEICLIYVKHYFNGR